MNINTKLTNITLTPDVSNYLDKKLKAIEEKFLAGQGEVFAYVELSRDTGHRTGDIFKADISIEIPGNVFRAESSAASILAAIDEMDSQLTKELERSKDKGRSLLRRTGAAVKDALRGIGRIRFRR